MRIDTRDQPGALYFMYLSSHHFESNFINFSCFVSIPDSHNCFLQNLIQLAWKQLNLDHTIETSKREVRCCLSIRPLLCPQYFLTQKWECHFHLSALKGEDDFFLAKGPRTLRVPEAQRIQAIEAETWVITAGKLIIKTQLIQKDTDCKLHQKATRNTSHGTTWV